MKQFYEVKWKVGRFCASKIPIARQLVCSVTGESCVHTMRENSLNMGLGGVKTWCKFPACENKLIFLQLFCSVWAPASLGEFTRSHTGSLFTLYLSGYRYANRNPYPFIKTWGVRRSPPSPFPHMTACSSDRPKMAPISARIYTNK